MIKGLLLVNSFVNSNKFYDLYSLLSESGKKHDVSLNVLRTCDLDINNIGDIDFIIFWDKDIDLARLLEKNGYRVFNKAEAIERCDDKALTYVELLKTVKMPKTILGPKLFSNNQIDNYDFLDKYLAYLGNDIVIKEVRGSFGRQVYLAHNKEELMAVLKRIHDKPYLLQEYLKSSYGRDIRVNVVGKKVVCAMGRENKNDFRANITNGGHYLKVELNDSQIKMATKACEKLDLDFAGVDLLYGENDEPVLCEVNSNPHFRSSLDCTGVNMADYILEYILREIC